MGEKWPKIDHIPPHFYFGAHIPPQFWALGVASPQISVYRFLVPGVVASHPRNWVLPGVIRQTVGGGCDLLGVEHTVGWGGSARGAASSHWWFRVRTTARRWRGRFLGRGPRRHCLIPQVGCSTVYFWSKGADIWLPGIYFASLPRSQARNHRAGAHFLSYYPWWQWMETLCMRKNLAAQCVLDG